MYLHPHTVFHQVPKQLPVEIAVLFNPLAAGIRWATTEPDLRIGDTIVILGAGQRGLSCVIAAKAAGAGQIIVTDLARSANKLELAQDLGADAAIVADEENVVEAVKRLTGGQLADVVVDVTPVATQPILDAIEIVRFGGTVILAGVWTTGVGQHQMWAMQYLTVDRPRSFVTSGGHGTMGFGLPAAIGAQLARPGATVVCVDGDGSFQMTLQELATAAGLALPVILVIVNNGNLGMVRQWQSMFWGGRLCDVDLTDGMPDFAAVARGFGAAGVQVSDLDSLDRAFTQARSAGRPTVIDVLVEPEENCYPMIVPGGAAAEQVEFPIDPGE
jgi:glyoxylate carboligase